MTSEDPKVIRAAIRNDIVRRLFAVAISVGFGATLWRMQWLTDGIWPSNKDWQQLFILLVAMTATVLSWDGYLMSIKEKPLFSFWRFVIDVTLIFTYMILLWPAPGLVDTRLS